MKRKLKRVMLVGILSFLGIVLFSCNALSSVGSSVAVSLPSYDYLKQQLFYTDGSRTTATSISDCPIAIVVKEIEASTEVVLETKVVTYTNDSVPTDISFAPRPLGEVVDISIEVLIDTYTMSVQSVTGGNLSAELQATSILKGTAQDIIIMASKQKVDVTLSYYPNALAMKINDPEMLVVFPIFIVGNIDEFLADPLNKVDYITDNNYTYQWYICDVNGENSAEIPTFLVPSSTTPLLNISGFTITSGAPYYYKCKLTGIGDASITLESPVMQASKKFEEAPSPA